MLNVIVAVRLEDMYLVVIRWPVWMPRIATIFLFISVVVYFENYKTTPPKIDIPEHWLFVLNIEVLAIREILSNHVDLT